MLGDQLCFVHAMFRYFKRCLILGLFRCLCHQALEVVPYTLAENAGLNPINIVTELRKAHANGQLGGGGGLAHVLFVLILIDTHSVSRPCLLFPPVP